MKKSLTTYLRSYDGKLWSFVFPFNKEDVVEFIDDDRRVLLYFNAKEYIHCALMPDGLGDFFININKETRKKYKLEEDDKVNIQLCKDTSKYGMPVPDELEELWKTNNTFHSYFQNLTAGKQRNLLHLVNKIKSKNKRQEKAIVIYQYLLSSKGELDFKALNKAFKEGVL